MEISTAQTDTRDVDSKRKQKLKQQTHSSAHTRDFHQNVSLFSFRRDLRSCRFLLRPCASSPSPTLQRRRPPTPPAPPAPTAATIFGKVSLRCESEAETCASLEFINLARSHGRRRRRPRHRGASRRGRRRAEKVETAVGMLGFSGRGHGARRTRLIARGKQM